MIVALDGAAPVRGRPARRRRRRPRPRRGRRAAGRGAPAAPAERPHGSPPRARRRGARPGGRSRAAARRAGRRRRGRAGAQAAPAPAPAAAIDDHVVSRRLDEAVIAAPARAVTAREGLEGPDPARHRRRRRHDRGHRAQGPAAPRPRPATASTRRPAGAARAAPAFAQVRFGRSGDKVRVVLDAPGALPAYQVKRVPGGVAVLAARRRAPARRGRRRRPPPARAADGPGRRRAPARGRAGDAITDLRFAQQGGPPASRSPARRRHVGVAPRPPHRGPHARGRGARRKKLERSLDTSAFQGPVLMVSSFNQPTTGKVRIVATLRGEASRPGGRDRGRARLDRSEPAPAARREGRAVDGLPTPQAAGFASEAPGYARLRRAAGPRLHRPAHHPRLPRHRDPQPAPAHRRRLEEEHRRRRRRHRQGHRLAAQRALGPGARPRAPVEGARQGGDGQRHPHRQVRRTSPRSRRPARRPRRPAQPLAPAQGADHPGELRRAPATWRAA